MSGLGLGASDEPPPAQSITIASSGSVSELEKATEYWGQQAAKKPRDGAASLNYAKNLKAMGRKKEALAVLAHSHIYNAQNKEHLSEYGRLALELGQVSTAQQLLERADDPVKPDWRVISARGTVLARQERFKEAIPFFERARQLAPDQPSVLSNLAMAYAMDGEAQKAEQLLRQAAQMGPGDSRVRQNLSLVLGLQGKYDEAKQVVSADPSAEAAQANLDYLRTAIAPEAKTQPEREEGVATPKALAKADVLKAPLEPVARTNMAASPKTPARAQPRVEPNRVMAAAERPDARRPRSGNTLPSDTFVNTSDPDAIIAAALQAEAAKSR
jgi:Flp pilus assembly protein TadD